MKFAKWSFLVAGIYGLLITTPMYWMEFKIGIDNPPAITHPEYFYGFLGVVIAWQLAFLVIASNPKQYRLLMLPSIVEKVLGGGAFIVLVLLRGINPALAFFGSIDLILGLLFLISYRASDRA